MVGFRVLLTFPARQHVRATRTTALQASERELSTHLRNSIARIRILKAGTVLL